ncbi:MAG: TonB-dependent receptor domain-containing protein, partial [Rhodoluna sp.]
TLILVDGHRVATAGVNQASVDPDLIPTGAIARVEVVTEGGSSTYGTDAVAGVINFITRKRFNGLEVGGHYGFAKDYWQWDASVTAGKDWGSGSLWASYSYAKSDALFGRDRAYIRDVNYAVQPYVGRDLTCPNSNIVAGTTINGDTVLRNVKSYAAPGFVAGTSNLCDNSENSSIIPRAERHGVMVGLSQDLSDKTSVEMRAYYSQRNTLATSDLTGNVALGPNSPYKSALPSGVIVGPTTLFGFPATASLSVNFNLRPLLGDQAAKKHTTIKQYGWNAEFKHNLDGNWQIRALLNYGESDTTYGLGQISQARLNAAGAPPVGATAANSFNPLDVTVNNAALVADLIDSEIAGQATDHLFDARLIADGKLIALPAGDVRVALGYEYINDSLSRRFSRDVRKGQLNTVPFSNYGRNINSVFGELQIPVLDSADGTDMLMVSGSARYDKYSDFGSTFNPKVGVTFKPVNWFTLRGNWGTSFTAPTPLDQLGSLANFTSYNAGIVAFARPGETAPTGGGTVAIQGSLPGLQPQKAKTWSIGADVEPMQGMRFSANYYNVHFSNILRTPFSATPFTDYPANYFTKVAGFTPAEVAAFFGSTPGAATTIAAIGSQTVYEMVDFRTGNFGVLDVKGLDLSASYNMQTGFGGLDFAANANLPLSRKAQISPTSAVRDELLTDSSKLSLQTTVGLTTGGFRAQATVNYNAGYNIVPITTIAVPQSRVGSFTVVNLYFKYDVPADSGLLKGLSFSLNVNNVFDQDPSELRRNNSNEYGFANGFTLGRMFMLGATKKF